MAVVLGYGGLANTNGARDFSGKVEVAPVVSPSRIRYFASTHMLSLYMWAALLAGRIELR